MGLNTIKIFQKKARKKNEKNNKTKSEPLTLNPKYIYCTQPSNTVSRPIENMELKNLVPNSGKYSNLSHEKSKEIVRILLHLEREYILKG